MKRLSAVALLVGVLTASCSGHGGSSAVPQSFPQSDSGPSTRGAHTTRPAALASAPAGWAATATGAL
ncbi:MAG: hypothetical protein JO175_01285, partial [Candidatus Eremiobacteraeota bacterium]|nr:hypothetical protein [Candidatus Eremiobacteraeota bacterium]